MRSKSMMLFTLLVFCACQRESTPGPVAGSGKAGPPQIACDQPVYDFGTALQGKKIVHVFTIRNKGGEPLLIERARGG